MTLDDALFNLGLLREALREEAKRYPLLPGLVYTSPHDFIAQHGIDYLPSPWSKHHHRYGGVGVQKQCFGNAIARAGLFGLKYVEGFAVGPKGEVICHAWNARPDGELVDCTWANTGAAYIGVEFSVERADEATWDGDAHVINDEHRNYPIFQRRWTGEDYTIVWPPSDRLDALRRGDRTNPPSVQEWLARQV